ncbi:MAG: ATP-dependent Clp protease proteolytic subunit [Pseudomonadota bacterium]
MVSQNHLKFAGTLALFATLGLFAWKSGRKVYETGPQLAISEERGAVVLSWSDDIEAPMSERFARAFEERKGRTDRFLIDLNSPGGSIAEGRLVIAEIERMKRTHRVDAYVGDGAVCLSMCVPIYLQGERRTAAPSARFMFHEPSSYDLVTDEKVGKPGFEQRMTSERFFARYFASSEMNAEWREKLRQNWKGRDLWFTAEELAAQGANVVEELE